MSGGTWLPLAPFLAALITALAAFPLRDRVAGRLVSVAGAVAELVAAAFVLRRVMAEGPLAGQLGGWAAPYGITVVADPLASAMLVLTGVVALERCSMPAPMSASSASGWASTPCSTCW